MLQIKEEYETVEVVEDDVIFVPNNESENKLALNAFVYTTRLDQMLVFKEKLTSLNIDEVMVSIEKESKPKFRSLPKFTSPPVSDFRDMAKKIESVNKRVTSMKRLKERYYKQICKPLKIVLEDFRLHKAYKNILTNKLEKSNTLQLILSNISTKEMEVYTFQDRSIVSSYYKVKECAEKKVQLHINEKENIKYVYCCWYKRKDVLNILQNIILKSYSVNIFKFLNRPHDCSFGQCKCCCAPKANSKSIFSMGRDSSVKIEDMDKINLENLINKSLRKYCELNYKNENPWYDQLLSELNKDSLVSKALHYERKRNDNTNLFHNEVAENRNFEGVVLFKQDYSYKDVYHIDKSGNVLGHKQRAEMLYTGVPSYVLTFSPCCWFNRNAALAAISKSHNIKSTSLQYMSVPHRCPQGQCNCCCKTQCNCSSKECNIVAPEMAKTHFNGNKRGRPRKQKTCVAQIHIEPTPAKVDTTNSAEVSVDVLISTILDRFKDVRLSINEEGKVAVSLNTPVHTLSSAELKVLSQILSHAQKTVTELGIRPGSNLSNSTLSTTDLINHLKINSNKVVGLQTPPLDVNPPACKSNIYASKPTILNYFLDRKNTSTIMSEATPNKTNLNTPKLLNPGLLQSQSVMLGQKSKEYVKSFQSLNSLPVIQNVFSIQDNPVPLINNAMDLKNSENKPWYKKPEEVNIEESTHSDSFQSAIEPKEITSVKRKSNQQESSTTAKIRVLSPDKLVASNTSNIEQNNPIPPIHSVVKPPVLTVDGSSYTIIINDQPLAQNNVNIKNQSSFQDEFISMTQKLTLKPKQNTKEQKMMSVTNNKEASKEVPTFIDNPQQTNAILNPVFLINPMQSPVNGNNSIKSVHPGVGKVLIPTVVQVTNTAAPTILQSITNPQPGVEKCTILEAALTRNNNVKIENTPFACNNTPVLESIVIEDDDEENNGNGESEDFSILGM